MNEADIRDLFEQVDDVADSLKAALVEAMAQGARLREGLGVMRKPILTNKVLRGLQVLSWFAVEVTEFRSASQAEIGDAKRAREWIAAMGEWWRSTHKGVKL